jgi:hypothetical protein
VLDNATLNVTGDELRLMLEVRPEDAGKPLALVLAYYDYKSYVGRGGSGSGRGGSSWLVNDLDLTLEGPLLRPAAAGTANGSGVPVGSARGGGNASTTLTGAASSATGSGSSGGGGPGSAGLRVDDWEGVAGPLHYPNNLGGPDAANTVEKVSIRWLAH